MKIDVPHIFHPYMIGPSGRKSQDLMVNNSVLVHYNDSNFRCPTWPKMNTVTIDGRVKNVEAARSGLRDRMPLTIWINTKLLDDPQTRLEMVAKAFSDRNLPSVNRVCFGEPDKESPHIRTELYYAGPVTAICDNEIVIASGENGSGTVYTAEIPTLSLINPWNIELSQSLVDYIEGKSGCRILYPPMKSFSGEPPSYYVQGNTMEGMMFAIRHLFGFSMIEITFLVYSNNLRLDNARIDMWERECGVYVFAHRAGNSRFTAVSLFSFEFNISNVYRIYATILGYMAPVRTYDYKFMEDAIDLLPMDVFESCKLFFLLGGTDKCGGGADDEFTNRCFYRQYYGNPGGHAFARLIIDRSLSGQLMQLVNGRCLDVEGTERLQIEVDRYSGERMRHLSYGDGGYTRNNVRLVEKRRRIRSI